MFRRAFLCLPFLPLRVRPGRRVASFTNGSPRKTRTALPATWNSLRTSWPRTRACGPIVRRLLVLLIKHPAWKRRSVLIDEERDLLDARFDHGTTPTVDPVLSKKTETPYTRNRLRGF